MDGFDRIEDIPDEDWKKLTAEQKDAYNRRIDSAKEYKKAINLDAPIALFVVGCIVGFFGIFEMTLGIFGGFLCTLAILWALMRVVDRAHRYQRVRDASDEFKRVME